MHKLPNHGRVSCTRCYPDSANVEFDVTRRIEGGWRITANPLAWGSATPKIVILGFSKGPTQAGALATTPHNDIAYRGGRTNIGKVLSHVGLLDIDKDEGMAECVTRCISDPSGDFHFASLIRCTVERYEASAKTWKGTGGRMLDGFMEAAFGAEVAAKCIGGHLLHLPPETKLVIMFGLGTRLGYVRSVFKLMSTARPGDWKWINEVAYTDGTIVIVHVEHFAVQGSHLDDWLNTEGHPRGRYSLQARQAIALSGVVAQTPAAPTSPPIEQRNAARVAVASPRRQKQQAENTTGLASELAQIVAAIAQSGFSIQNAIDKVTAFRSRLGHVVYLNNKTSRLNAINLMVHPNLPREQLESTPGVAHIGERHTYHANLTAFPRRINKGKKDIPFAWPVHIEGICDLERFLSHFSQLSP